MIMSEELFYLLSQVHGFNALNGATYDEYLASQPGLPPARATP